MSNTRGPVNGGGLVGFDKEAFFGDVEGVFENAEFVLALGDIIGKRFTLSELLELINSYRVGGSVEEWISRIDEFFEGIEILDEFVDYIVEMEKLREIIRTYLCMFIIAPRVVALIRATLAYLLIVLQYGQITRLSEVTEREKAEQRSGEEDILLSVYYRIFATVTYMTMKTFLTQAPQFVMGGIGARPIEWTTEESSELDDRGKLKLDIGAWRDFNEYLVECGDIFADPTNNNPQQGCVVM